MKISSIQSTNYAKSYNNNFKGLWGNVINSTYLGEDVMYGGEVSVSRYKDVQEYFPFSDETPEMTKEAIEHHKYNESSTAPYTSATAVEITAKIMPKLAITAQEFIDYITNSFGKEFFKERIESKLTKANLTKYIK